MAPRLVLEGTAHVVTNAFQNTLDVIATFLPRLALFLVILFIGWLIALGLRKALNAILERVGFDRVVERGGIKQALARSQYDASDIVSRLVYYTIMLFVLQFAFGVFGPNPISDLIERIIAFLPGLIIAIIIVIIAAAIASAVRGLISNTLSGLSYGRTLGTIAFVFILGLGIIAALEQVGVATAITTPILIAILATIGGILVVGVGGGLVEPMRSRWSRWLSVAETETENIRREARTAPSVEQQARQAAAHYQAETGVGTTASTRTAATRPIDPRDPGATAAGRH
jgi:hypothetical protein